MVNCLQRLSICCSMRMPSVVLILLAGGCVSRSDPAGRFAESAVALASASSPVTTFHPSDPDHFSFGVVGDLHIRSANTLLFRRMLSMAADEGDGLFIVLGDIVDQGDRSDVVAYRQTIAESGWERRVLSVIGNHDVFGDGWRPFLELNGPSHWMISVGNSEFIALDTADGSVHPAEVTWLEDQLAKGKARHRFLLSHYPPRVAGQVTYLRLADEQEAIRLMALASRGGVHGWLSAHYHSYVLDQLEGVTYLVAGGGGGRRLPPLLQNFFVQVVVDGERVEYRVREVRG